MTLIPFDGCTHSRGRFQLMQQYDAIEIAGKVARKQPDLPRFLVVPATLVASWGVDATTTVDAMINGIAVARRTLKPWTPRAWFVTITQEDCRSVGIDTGARVRLTLRRVSETLPEELSAVLRDHAEARERWQGLTRSQQRMLQDAITAAKQSSTRRRRAERALVG